MKTHSASLDESKVSTLLITGALLFHFLLINRNMDPLHDGIFFSYGLAAADGFAMHREITTPYGPIVPWMLSIAIEIFGEFLLIPRVIGFVFLVGISIIFYLMMTKYIGKLKSSLIVTLWLLVQSGISEVTSTRWPYGSSIWPTTVSIFAHMVLLYKLVEHFTSTRKVDKKRDLAIFFLIGFIVAIAGFSRLQGMVTLLVALCLIILLFLKKYLEIRVFLSMTSGIVLGLALTLSMLAKQNSLFPFFEQNILGAFRFAESYMGGSAISMGWLKALIMGSVLGVLTGFAIFVCLLALSHWSLLFRAITVATIAFPLAFLILSVRRFELPEDLNRDLKLYLIKILQSFANTFIWPLGLVFFIVIVVIAFVGIKSLSKKEFLSAFSNPLSITALVLGLTSITHLYINFGYIWIITPITLPTAFILLHKFNLLERFALRLRVALMGYVSVGILIYATVFFFGLTLATTSDRNSFMYGSIRNIEYSHNLDEVLQSVQENLVDRKSIFFRCDNFYLIESLDTHSYKLKSETFRTPATSDSSIAQLIDRNSNIEVLVLCNPKANQAVNNELFRLGWNLSQYVNFYGIETMAILKRQS